MSKPWIDAQDDGEDVVIRVCANDADRIAHALRMHGRRSICAQDYYHMAEAIEVAVEQAFENGAIPAPGLSFVVVPK